MKKHLYTSLIRPVTIYGSETWSLSKKEENKFAVFKRKVTLRKVDVPKE